MGSVEFPGHVYGPEPWGQCVRTPCGFHGGEEGTVNGQFFPVRM